jgi:tubulin-specific chaperone C
MGRLGETALIGGERTDAIEHLVAGIARLGSEVGDASSYLPAYDQRTYGEVLKSRSWCHGLQGSITDNLHVERR